MTRVVAGLDIGGTKTAIVVESMAGERIADVEIRSEEWEASPPGQAAAWIATRLANVVPQSHDIVAAGIGAQGCDTVEHCEALQDGLRALGHNAVVVNDAALLVPAAGLETGIGVISGTGAIGVGQDVDGSYLLAGGWGWVLGDDAGAAGIVRDATRAALLRHDRRLPDDGLLRALEAAFGVNGPEALARAVNDEPTVENWAPRCPAVFEAAEQGAASAVAVIDGGAAHLVTLVDQLIRRGALGSDVVAAGSVIVNQPRLFAAFTRLLRDAHPGLSPRLLREPPVTGGVALARRLATAGQAEAPPRTNDVRRR
ncbi:MAG: hypothetical protein JWQ95_5575 [Sphaerisporangium sp.]|nr:hypothetical protein [Sphaerisporangium sp.]